MLPPFVLYAQGSSKQGLPDIFLCHYLLTFFFGKSNGEAAGNGRTVIAAGRQGDVKGGRGGG